MFAQLNVDCFPRHAWCAVSVFFHDMKFLLEAFGILSLCGYCSSIGLQIVFLGKHGVHLSVFFRDVKFLLEAVGILSLCEYC